MFLKFFWLGICDNGNGDSRNYSYEVWFLRVLFIYFYVIYKYLFLNRVSVNRYLLCLIYDRYGFREVIYNSG